MLVTLVRHGYRGIALLALAMAHVGQLPAGPTAAPLQARDAGGKIQGMTLSTARGSAEWGRDHIVPAITDLRGLGVNWIAIHPYARVDRSGEVRVGRGSDDLTSAPDWLRRPIEEAHRQGVKILIKPHLAYWPGFSWRGEIEFPTEEQWRRFFAGYRGWITALARFSEGADAFAVGTELDRTVARESEWREIITAVRVGYAGPLTYAANWTDYEDIPFWDALDAIGIQAYFPVLERSRVEGRVPSQEEFDAGWESIMERLRSFRERQGKAIVSKPAVVGAFLWKWFPGTRQPRDFAMSSPAMRQVISEFWATPATSDVRD